MRNVWLSAICATSFLVSGYTGCGENFADDIKTKAEGDFKRAGTQCAEHFEAKTLVGKLAVGCYTQDEIEARIKVPTEVEVAQCAAQYSKCSEADQQAIADTTKCLKELAQCDEAGLDAWEAAVSDCEAIVSEVTCSAPFTDADSDDADEAP